MSRLADTFAALRREGRPGLVTYTTAGDPDLPRSAEILEALARAGADVLEVGVPFSDPLADGPVIQRATERALAAGGSLRASLDLIASVRSRVSTPIVVFSYANPIVRMGLDAFAERAAAVGVDGVRSYTAPPLMPDRSDVARRQAELWGNPRRRISVARHMYALRLGEILPHRELDTLRGI